MKRVNEILLVIIFTLTAVLAAAVGLKAYDIYDTNRRLAREQEEMELAQVLARNEEVQSRVVQLQKEILELAEDREELERFINRLENSELLSAVEDLADGTGTVSSNDMVSGNNSTVSSNAAVSGNGTMTSDGMISGNDTVSSNSTVSGNGTVSSNSTVSGNGMMLSGKAFLGVDTVSSNGTVSFNGIIIGNGTVSGNLDAFGNVIPDIKGSAFANGETSSIYGKERMRLEERRQLQSSLEETLEMNLADREQIAKNKTDFRK